MNQQSPSLTIIKFHDRQDLPGLFLFLQIRSRWSFLLSHYDNSKASWTFLPNQVKKLEKQKIEIFRNCHDHRYKLMGFHCETYNKCRNNSNPNSADGDESYDKFLYFLLSGRMIRIECVDLFKMRSLSGAPGSNYILIEHLSLVSSPHSARPIKLQQVIFHFSGCLPAQRQCQQWQVGIFTFIFLSSPPSNQPFSLAPKALIGLKSMLGWIHFEISWMKEVLDPTVICKYV